MHNPFKKPKPQKDFTPAINQINASLTEINKKLKTNDILPKRDYDFKRVNVSYENGYKTAEERDEEWNKMTPSEKQKYNNSRYVYLNSDNHV